jgi:glutamine amidotransferase
VTSAPGVVVLDYGSGNVRSACRALERAGAAVTLTADSERAARADGVVVPGVGAFASCMAALRVVGAGALLRERLARGGAVLGICVGMQVLFERGVEHGVQATGFGLWPGTVEQIAAPVLPHMGWNTVQSPARSRLFESVGHERFYFVHSYGVQHWPSFGAVDSPVVTWSEHAVPFVAAVEDGPLSATQFHPEKSGEAGRVLLRNWLATL